MTIQSVSGYLLHSIVFYVYSVFLSTLHGNMVKFLILYREKKCNFIIYYLFSKNEEDDDENPIPNNDCR